MKQTYSRSALVILALVTVLFIPYGLNKKPPVETVYEMPDSALTVVNAIDQDAPLEHPDFIKEAFIPVIPEGINVALEGKAEVSSFVGAYTARKTIDGKTGGASYWEALPDSYPNTLTLDLGKVETINAIRVLLNPDGIWGARTQTFSVIAGKSEEGLTELVAEKAYVFDPDLGNEALLTFDPVEVQFVQLIASENTGSGGAQVAEFEIYAMPSND